MVCGGLCEYRRKQGQTASGGPHLQQHGCGSVLHRLANHHRITPRRCAVLSLLTAGSTPPTGVCRYLHLLRGHNSAFCSIAEKLWIGSKKMAGTFQDGHESSTTVQSLGENEQRAPAVGARIWCLYVFVTLRGRRAVCSMGYILSRFCVAFHVVDFDALFSVFFQKRLSAFQMG